MLDRTNRTLSASITRPNLRTRSVVAQTIANNMVNDTLRNALAYPQGECMSPRVGSFLGKVQHPPLVGKHQPILPGSSASFMSQPQTGRGQATRSRWLLEAEPEWRPVFDIAPGRPDRSGACLPASTQFVSTDQWTTKPALRKAALGS